MVNEAALSAARMNRKQVTMYDFELAKDKVLMGAERKSMLLTEEEKRVTAYHEAGHALVSFLREHSDPIHKVTIIPRGMALGVTIFLPGDRHNYTREYLEAKLAMSYGGRVAEEIFLNQMSTGAGSDIEVATDLARRMVCEYGMSRLGPLTFGKKEEQIFLGREISQHRDFSEETARQIDLEVRRLIDEAYQTAHSIVDSNKDAMHRIAAALLERETIDAEEVRMLIEGMELPPLRSILASPTDAGSSERSRYSSPRAAAALGSRKARPPRRRNSSQFLVHSNQKGLLFGVALFAVRARPHVPGRSLEREAHCSTAPCNTNVPQMEWPLACESNRESRARLRLFPPKSWRSIPHAFIRPPFFRLACSRHPAHFRTGHARSRRARAHDFHRWAQA